MTNVLVLYYSRSGSVSGMAREVARGVSTVAGVEARLRTVPAVMVKGQSTDDHTDDRDNTVLMCTADDLQQCHGLVLGSPCRFSHMAAPLRYFFDQNAASWANGSLLDKPAAVFTSSSSLHGGQESTLLSMMTLLFHHGMLVMGLPYSEPALHHTTTGGGPYGASHVATNGTTVLSDDEKHLCRQLGKRVAQFALRLHVPV